MNLGRRGQSHRPRAMKSLTERYYCPSAGAGPRLRGPKAWITLNLGPPRTVPPASRSCVSNPRPRSTMVEPATAASSRRGVPPLVLGAWLSWASGAANRNRSGTMNEIPNEMRSMANASFDQARKSFEKFVAGAQETAGSIEERGATVREGAKDIGAKAMSYAEKNIHASLDYGQ